MNSVNKTLYIPLYGKAFVSRKGLLLRDSKAEEIWAAEGFRLRGKAKSKWLAYYMGMRSAVFDDWLCRKMEQYPDAVVLHLGCGMDSRICRVGCKAALWFDVDFPQVIEERKHYYRESEWYHMLSADIREEAWMQEIPKERPVIVLMEGVSMYITSKELKIFAERLKQRFPQCYILMDCYTVFAAKATRYKNPIREVGVTRVYGLDDPAQLLLTFVQEHSLTPEEKIKELGAMEQIVFRTLFAGSFAKKIYRLFEFST